MKKINQLFVLCKYMPRLLLKSLNFISNSSIHYVSFRNVLRTIIVKNKSFFLNSNDMENK